MANQLKGLATLHCISCTEQLGASWRLLPPEHLSACSAHALQTTPCTEQQGGACTCLSSHRAPHSLHKGSFKKACTDLSAPAHAYWRPPGAAQWCPPSTF